MYLEEKSVHVKHQNSYFLSISCKYFYTRIFRTHILYTLTTALPSARHAHNDRKRFVPNKILEGKPIPRSFHSFALEMKLFDSPFFLSQHIAVKFRVSNHDFTTVFFSRTNELRTFVPALQNTVENFHAFFFNLAWIRIYVFGITIVCILRNVLITNYLLTYQLLKAFYFL